MLAAVSVSVGTLTSSSAWLAVAETMAAGFLSAVPLFARSRLEALAPALLLSFMLGVATPAPPTAALAHLEGWLLAAGADVAPVETIS